MLYVPSAQTLIEGGHFLKGEDGLWETPEVAKALLRSMVTNHAKDLEKLTSSSGESLLKVIIIILIIIIIIRFTGVPANLFCEVPTRCALTLVL